MLRKLPQLPEKERTGAPPPPVVFRAPSTQQSRDCPAALGRTTHRNRRPHCAVEAPAQARNDNPTRWLPCQAAPEGTPVKHPRTGGASEGKPHCHHVYDSIMLDGGVGKNRPPESPERGSESHLRGTQKSIPNPHQKRYPTQRKSVVFCVFRNVTKTRKKTEKYRTTMATSSHKKCARQSASRRPRSTQARPGPHKQRSAVLVPAAHRTMDTGHIAGPHDATPEPRRPRRSPH